MPIRIVTIVPLLMISGCGLLESGPDPATLARNAKQRGYLALQRQDYEAAAAAYREAATTLPQDPFVQLNLGVAEEHLGKLDAARAAYQLAEIYGKDVSPADVTDPRYAGRTVAQLAKDDLAGMEPDKAPTK